MWKDISSFSKAETDRSPKTFELKANGIRIVVMRHRDYPLGTWVARAEPYFSELQLKSIDSDSAQKEAIEIVKNCLAKTLAALDV